MDDDDRTTEPPKTDPERDTPEDIKTGPPSNPPADEQAVEEGEDKLGRVKPY